MRRPTFAPLALLLAANCGGEPKKAENEACRATYTKLEELGCIEKTKEMFARGCFVSEVDLRPADCDSSQLDACVAELSKFENQPLDEFLMANCNPSGPQAFEMPAPDLVALRRAKTAADRLAAEAEAARLAKEAQAAEAKAAVEKAVTVQELAVEGAGDRSIIQYAKFDHEGGLKIEDLLSVTRGGLTTYRDCHAAVLVNHPDASGKVSIHFLIDPQGAVTSAIVQGSTIDDADLSTCMTSAVKLLRFPASKDGTNTTVTVEFQFDVFG
jgi:hypothetical protein